MNQPQVQTQNEQTLPRKASVIQVAKIVSSSFLGVSKLHDNDSAVSEVTLKQIVVVALVGVAVFIGFLLIVVSLITR